MLHERLGCPVRVVATAEAAAPLFPAVAVGDAYVWGSVPMPAGGPGAGVAFADCGSAGCAVVVPVQASGETIGVIELVMPAQPGPELLADLQACAAVVGLLVSRDVERARVEQLNAMFDHIAHPIFVKDRAYRWVLLNQAFCDLVGWPKEQLLLKSDYDFFSKEQADWFRAKDTEMFESRKVVQIDEEPITDAHGKTHVLATTKVPLFGPDGSVLLLVGIIHDITELKAAQAQLQRMNEELGAEVRQRTAVVEQLDELNRDLESFSYSVSHDLRAPLRSIDGFSRAVLEDSGDALDEQSRNYLERVLANTQRMGQLIDDILALSRVSRTPLRPGPVDLAVIAREIVDRLREAEPDRAVEVTIAEPMTARADARLIGVALENLLRNAWKFTARASPARIEFGSTEQDGKRVFYVRDNGAGFPTADVDKLFRPFSRLHRAEEFPGTGIGLATVQRIVHRHGGRIWAEGEPGKGATFSFTLPG